jgi:hypothetical protein
MNRAMERKLRTHRAIDVSGCKRTATGDYILPEFVDDVDYCDAQSEEWIWSIGKLLRPLPSVMANNERRELPAGTFLASTSSRYYNPDCESDAVECVWLR